MDMTEIRAMTEKYEELLAEEYNANAEVAEALEALEGIKARALADAQAEGKINGKNADSRKRQAEAIIMESTLVDASKAILHRSETDAANVQIQRKGHDALIGLTKAWLYSQSGH